MHQNNKCWEVIFKFVSNSKPSGENYEFADSIFDEFFKESPSLNENQVVDIINIFKNPGNLKNCKNFDTFHILFTIRYSHIIENIKDSQLKYEWFNNEIILNKLQMFSQYSTHKPNGANSPLPCIQ